ncbi:MAG: hypothetical protein A4S09_10475 [Proteobacteria bacterium SG_bin7]|nr:MAG: hypothetical protein A4S09_10475 [Proteobacteria bacterium SG_bin7]
MELKLKLSEKFGMNNSDNRKLIRECLLVDLKADGYKVVDSAVTNLDFLPTCNEVGISISHTSEIGGYVIGCGVEAVGFDIESTERVSKKLADRIAKSDESYPAPDFFWCAKESAYKMLGSLGKAPAVISDLKIHSWSEESANSVEFKFEGGQGRVWREKTYTLAVAWV